MVMREQQCVIIWPAKDRVNRSVPASLTRKPVGGNQQFYYFLNGQVRSIGRPFKQQQQKNCVVFFKKKNLSKCTLEGPRHGLSARPKEIIYLNTATIRHSQFLNIIILKFKSTVVESTGQYFFCLGPDLLGVYWKIYFQQSWEYTFKCILSRAENILENIAPAAREIWRNNSRTKLEL